MKRSLSRKERKNIFAFIVAAVTYALLWTPIDNLISNALPSDTTRLVVGIVFILGLAYFWRFKT